MLMLSFLRSNFAPAFYCMPKEKRQALKTLYAFCHEVDSIADDGLPREIAEKHIEACENLLQCPSLQAQGSVGLYARSQEYENTPIKGYTTTRLAMTHAVSGFEIPKKHLLDIIEGVKLDLVKQRYATFAGLQAYCYKVASAVGLASLAIFRVPEDEGGEFAVKLGLAFQLTNILRDVKEDAARGRIYIPDEDMKLFDISDEDIREGIYSRRFVKLMRFEAERAKKMFEAAREALPAKYKCELRPALVMAAIYRKLLDKIERTGFDVFNQRIKLSVVEKWQTLKNIQLR